MKHVVRPAVVNLWFMDLQGLRELGIGEKTINLFSLI